MSEYNPPEGPWALQGPSSASPATMLRNSAASVRRVFGAIAKTSGIAGFGDLALSATGADKNISIATGGVWLKGTQATDQGVYFGYNAPTKVIDFLTANPAHATLARIDGIDALVEDTFYGGATDSWYLRQTVGTPSGSPVAPAVPANGFRLGTVLIPAASTVIAIANITDLRTVAYYGAGGPWKFYRNLLTATAASIVLPLPVALPGLDNLRVDWFARSDTAATTCQLLVRLNNDATANYDQEATTEGGSATAPVETLGATSILAGNATAATGLANKFGQGRIEIKNYAGAIGNKLVQGFWIEFYNITGNTGQLGSSGGAWRTVNTPLTRVDLIPLAGNWIIGSLFSAQFE